MKRILSVLRGHEKGQVMILALILLVVGVLIITPLLSYMYSGLKVGQAYEENMEELYAADSGVEDAIWELLNGLVVEPGDPTILPEFNMNDKDVNVTIESLPVEEGEPPVYRITSVASIGDSSTTIESIYASMFGDYSGILDNVITSQAGIDFPPHWEDLVDPSSGEHSPVDYYDGPWPTPDEIADFYWLDVKDETPYPSGTIDLAGVDLSIGPLYRDGPLEILNSSNTATTLTLTGTIYITGDTLIGKNGKKNLTLDLNGQTIFVESDSADPQKALWVGDKCTIIGPGVIIAIGDIYFEPTIDVGMTDPIFIMSVCGTTTLQPGGAFYGAVAGSVEVDLQPGTSINYPDGGFEGTGINFPDGGGSAAEGDYGIHTWEIK